MAFVIAGFFFVRQVQDKKKAAEPKSDRHLFRAIALQFYSSPDGGRRTASIT